MPVEAMPISQPEESEAERIARGLRRKDLTLVRELVERYQYRLVRYLIFLTARREFAEDWAQETWVRVLDRASQYDGRSRFEAWLFSIARNLAIDDLRRRQNVSLEAANEEPLDPTSPFVTAARNEEAARLAAALGTLEPIYREALLLRFHEDLSLQEISHLVGAPVPTVASRIRRGLERLRLHWERGADGA
uniref:RNA polymerase, sigma-24 subunit, ECF subfamily n=1 Tax=Solibacter usitatus (strain Ellin6076) TaxID=234267 RepID=Q029P7_SOLUE